MDAIQSKTLKSLLLPVPSTDEQVLIEARYGVIQEKLRGFGAKLQKLRQQKAGLMQDLLTGKVEVSV